MPWRFVSPYINLVLPWCQPLAHTRQLQDSCAAAVERQATSRDLVIARRRVPHVNSDPRKLQCLEPLVGTELENGNDVGVGRGQNSGRVHWRQVGSGGQTDLNWN